MICYYTLSFCSLLCRHHTMCLHKVQKPITFQAFLLALCIVLSPPICKPALLYNIQTYNLKIIRLFRNLVIINNFSIKAGIIVWRCLKLNVLHVYMCVYKPLFKKNSFIIDQSILLKRNYCYKIPPVVYLGKTIDFFFQNQWRYILLDFWLGIILLFLSCIGLSLVY